MSGQAFLDRLKAEFGDQITGANFEAIDPWIEVAPEGLVALCTYLRDASDLRFNMLNCISGVDYFEADPKKAAKTGWQPHLEVVYHLWSLPNKVSLVLKVILPRWKDDRDGELPEVPTVSGVWSTAAHREPYPGVDAWRRRAAAVIYAERMGCSGGEGIRRERSVLATLS